jgi:hypothetical protein
MPRSPGYLLDGETVTLAQVAAEFTAYGRHSIRDGLQAGHNTRKELLDYLVARSIRHEANLRARPAAHQRVYFADKRQRAPDR